MNLPDFEFDECRQDCAPYGVCPVCGAVLQDRGEFVPAGGCRQWREEIICPNGCQDDDDPEDINFGIKS